MTYYTWSQIRDLASRKMPNLPVGKTCQIGEYLVRRVSQNRYTADHIGEGWISKTEASNVLQVGLSSLSNMMKNRASREIKGRFVERTGKGSATFYRVSGAAEAVPEPEPDPVYAAGQCSACGCSLTPRRTVIINGLEACYGCQRLAFIGLCSDTRRRFGL